ncbi:hypothetical protein DL765_003156 [Monosporascus sp. GIB2]|nr:hypothetical protein DL765_003156 [Monosporascus sp. GIB2]
MQLASVLYYLASCALAQAGSALNSRGNELNGILTSAQWSSGTTLSFPGSESFTSSTERWTIFEAPTYAAAIKPATEADVVQAVNLATANGIPFLATGGRHGYTTTLGAIQNGLAIDLSHFGTVLVDKAAGTLTIGAGVRFRDIYDPVFDAGFEIQTGTASCPGMIGLTLGAGVGPWNGVHGLLIDALVSLRVVTANGTIVEASKDRNPDLFWALRGAGANFGIVTYATYKLQRQVNQGQIFSGDFVIPAEQNGPYFRLLEAYDGGRLSDKLSISTFMSYNLSTGVPQITANWAYLGPVEEGYEALAPVLNLKPIIGGLRVYPWNTFIRTVAGGADAYLCLDGQLRDIYTVNARNISASTYQIVFRKMSAFFDKYPTARASTIRIAMLPNQATLAVPDDETAYPWRDTLAYIDIILSWDGTNCAAAVKAGAESLGRAVRDDLAATSGYPTLAVYVNSAHGDESLESIYGASKLQRLSALKKDWDPTNVFAFNNALPIRYP